MTSPLGWACPERECSCISAGQFSTWQDTQGSQGWHGDLCALPICKNIFSYCRSCGRRLRQSCAVLGARGREKQLRHHPIRSSPAAEQHTSCRSPSQWQEKILSSPLTLHMELESWALLKADSRKSKVAEKQEGGTEGGSVATAEGKIHSVPTSMSVGNG